MKRFLNVKISSVFVNILAVVFLVSFVLWKFPEFQIAIIDFLKQYRTWMLGVITLLVIIFTLWKVPQWQVASLTSDPKDLIQLENNARRTLAQILGGAAILIGLYFTWRTVRVFQEGQTTERFSRAINQLGSNKLEVRLGGIYALERIANDSEKDHWPIMEVLTTYIQENAPWKGNKTPPKLATDIQAILTVLGRRTRTYEKWEDQRLNLAETDIRGAYLYRANLEGANLNGTHMEGSNLGEADLEGTDLSEANLEGANLHRANLKGASLYEADLEETDLSEADLEGTNLYRANLKGANLHGASLKGASLYEADLEETDLSEANLEGTHLFEANLEGAYLYEAHLKKTDLIRANLTDTTSLTQEQIDVAHGDRNTLLPKGLKKPGHWLLEGGSK